MNRYFRIEGQRRRAATSGGARYAPVVPRMSRRNAPGLKSHGRDTSALQRAEGFGGDAAALVASAAIGSAGRGTLGVRLAQCAAPFGVAAACTFVPADVLAMPIVFASNDPTELAYTPPSPPYFGQVALVYVASWAVLAGFASGIAVAQSLRSDSRVCQIAAAGAFAAAFGSVIPLATEDPSAWTSLYLSASAFGLSIGSLLAHRFMPRRARPTAPTTTEPGRS